jgi:ferrous iron transport protein B
LSIKLLEGDTNIKELVRQKSENVIKQSEVLTKRLEDTYQQPAFVTIASERYSIAGSIAHNVQQIKKEKPTFADRLDRITTHKIFGYITAFAVIAVLLLWTFTIGSLLSDLFSRALSFFQPVDPKLTGEIIGVLWNGVFGGLVAGVTLVIPYVIPFYLMLAVLEDSGILTRVAFMLDSAMHQMGLHGKAIIPLILGFGCNVPAIYSTRIMGTRRERLLAAFAITFAPCSARTIIILGLVATFVGVWWALALYVIDLLIMFIAVKIAVKTVPGNLTGLIMEMHSFKVPSISVIAKQTWGRTKSLIYMVFPIYMVGTAVVQILYAIGALNPVNNALSFLTVGWLGLPVIAGILLIFGAARKELILLTLVAMFGTNLAAALTHHQIIVLALVGAIYPCMATIGALTKEFGWKAAWAIIGANLAIAILVGGIAAKLLALVF